MCHASAYGVPGQKAERGTTATEAVGRRPDDSSRRNAHATTVALTENEVDKEVVDSDGTRLGTVSEVRHGRAHVTADRHVVEEF
ncbi:PRC-barrel domain-containing protein [Halorussus amylolyticus]|uniref:PRC-barrel domain-containing protein n=1 Tax=Halorussus amylolyticus TaxID=1126242 RepID=UPI001044838A|nr:PRC-barrel domain-containing protein [Halorussus amylolyticus]